MRIMKITCMFTDGCMLIRAFGIAILLAILWLPAASAVETGTLSEWSAEWSEIRKIEMKGDLKAFWNVHGRNTDVNEQAAVAHGFELVDLLGTYSDYPGKQLQKIVPDERNPWNKPPYFERIIRRNVNNIRGRSIIVHDIEFHFEEDIDDLWNDPQIRAASHAESREEFRKAYYQEWASWFTQPVIWAKERYPKILIGIYGPQPFRRDYWGVAGKDAKQIDGSHKTDAELWKYIGPVVDFSIASVYIFYDDPGSVYYMAANIEENYQRMRLYDDKPVYAYAWLRYHDSNAKLKGRELDDYLVEAMAVLPFFTGARGLVLWGWEPKGKGPYYRTLPLFMRSLGRVADLSGKIARAEMVVDEPAHVVWKEKRPLIRKLRVSDTECIVLAANPWQLDTDNKTVSVNCGSVNVDLTIHGKHTEIYHIVKGRAERIEMMPSL